MPPHSEPGRLSLSTPALLAIIALAYALGAESSYQWFGAINIGLAFYPPTGVTIAAVVLLPRRRWPVVLVGATLGELTISLIHGIAPGFAVGYLIANLVEPLLAGSVIRRSASVRLNGLRLDRRGPFNVFVAAILTAPIAGGAIGAAVRSVESGANYLLSWGSWWAGDALGALAIGAPLVFLLGPTPKRAPRWELIVGMLAMLPATYVSFWVFDLTPSLVLLPVLIWAVHRFGVQGVAAVAPVVCISATAATAAGQGVFSLATHGVQVQLLVTQVYLLIVVVAAWAIAISLQERTQFERDLATQAIEAARLRHSELVAQTLQTTMLSVPDPIAGMTIATRYLPAEQDMRVGGDWHDAIATPTAAVLTIGDVVGHHLPAAATMGQLRSATRAAAFSSAVPSTMLETLDRFASSTAGASGTTTCVITVDLSSGHTRFALAGHPPPLLAHPNGSTEWLDAPVGPPIGVGLSGWPDGEIALAPGDRLVLYTDGLIERRGEIIDIGLARLRAVVASNSHLAVEDLLAAVIDACAPQRREDDVAILIGEFVLQQPLLPASAQPCGGV